MNNLIINYLSAGFKNVVCIGLFLSYSLWSFSGSADSLDNLLQITEDTNRVILLLKISETYLKTEPDKAEQYIVNALTESQLLKYVDGLIQSNYLLAQVFHNKGEYKRALEYANKASELSQESNKEFLKGKIYSLTGLQYYGLGEYQNALQFFDQAFKFSKNNNDLNLEAKALNGMGKIYHKYGEYKVARKYFVDALKIFEQLYDEENKASCMNNTGLTYLGTGDIDSAFYCFTRSLEFYDKSDNTKDKFAPMNNLGLALKELGQCREALEIYWTALRLNKKVNNPLWEVFANNNIGDVYYEMESYDSSLNYFNRAYEIARNLDSKYAKRELYTSFYRTYQKLEDYENAFRFYRMMVEVSDSSFNERKMEEINNIREKYEAENKEKEIQIIRSENNKQQIELDQQETITYSLVAGTSLLIILAFVSFSNNQAKKKLFSVLKEQNQIIAEKTKDITDSIRYAKWIQNSILPDQKDFKKLYPGSFVINIPKGIVSGDLYMSREVNGHKILVAGNCLGQGVPGSMMTVMSIMLLEHVIVAREITEPSQILYNLQDLFRYFFKEKQWNDNLVNLTVLSYKHEAETFDISCANSHALLFNASENDISEIKSSPKGVSDNPETNSSFKTITYPFNKQNTIYFFTEGFAKQIGISQKRKDNKEVVKNILANIARLEMEKQEQVLNEKFIKDEEQVADLLFIGLKLSALA